MQIYTVVSVKDKATGLFSRPWFTRTHAEAIRIFTDEVNRNAEDNHISKHPEDYALIAVGLWDDTTGMFTSEEATTLVQAATIKEL